MCYILSHSDITSCLIQISCSVLMRYYIQSRYCFDPHYSLSHFNFSFCLRYFLLFHWDVFFVSVRYSFLFLFLFSTFSNINVCVTKILPSVSFQDYLMSESDTCITSCIIHILPSVSHIFYLLPHSEITFCLTQNLSSVSLGELSHSDI